MSVGSDAERWRERFRLVRPSLRSLSTAKTLDLGDGFARCAEEVSSWAGRGWQSRFEATPVVFHRGAGEPVEVVQRFADRFPLRMAAATRAAKIRHCCRFLDAAWILAGDDHSGADVQRRCVRCLEAVTSGFIEGYADRRWSARSPGTWNFEDATLMSWFAFLADPAGPFGLWGGVSPWPTWETGRGSRSALRGKPSTLSGDVRMLDDAEWRWFRHVGVAGLVPAAAEPLDVPGVLAPEFPERDGAFVDLAVTTGGRMSDLRCLLIDEVPSPTPLDRTRPWPSLKLRFGHERAKGCGGHVPAVVEACDAVWRWWRSEDRLRLVEAAQGEIDASYRLGDLFAVEEKSRDSDGRLHLEGRWRGERRSFTSDTLPVPVAERTVERGDGKLWMPLTIWQGHGGFRPMSTERIREVMFREPTRRVLAWGNSSGASRWSSPSTFPKLADVATGKVKGGVRPHFLRHTTACNWLVDLTLEADRRAREQACSSGRSPSMLPASGVFDPLFYVQKWLRHVSVSSTHAYQTWVNRHDWPADRTLGTGVALLVRHGEWLQ